MFGGSTDEFGDNKLADTTLLQFSQLFHIHVCTCVYMYIYMYIYIYIHVYTCTYNVVYK